MLIPTSTDHDFSLQTSNKLWALPALIDAYVLLVDQVMDKYGFSEERGEFPQRQALASMSPSGETAIHADATWSEPSQVDFLTDSPNAEWGEPEDTLACYEEEDLLVAAF